MAMKLVKKTESYSIFKRGDERYAVKDASKNAVNGEEKVRILVEEGLIKAVVPAVAEEPAEEEAAEGAAEDAPADEAPAAEASAEEAPAEEEAGDEDK